MATTPDYFIIDTGADRYRLPKRGWISRGHPEKDAPIHYVEVNPVMQSAREICGAGGSWHAKITTERHLVTCPKCLERIS